MREALILAAILLPASAFAWEPRFFVENYLYGQSSHPADSGLNPGNAALQIPDTEGVADIRPDLSLKSETFSAVARPRWVGRYSEWSQSGDFHRGADGRWNLMDGYFEYRPVENARMLTGLEVYQWGPAELMNVSNPLFHLRTNAHSAYFKEKGKVLVRVTYDQNENWNHMLILNPVSNNEEPFRSEQHFESTGLVKTELRSKSGGAYAGLVAGDEDDRLPFIGEYGMAGFESGWSIYVDARHTRGNHSFVPRTNAFGFDEMDQLRDDSTFETQGIGGIRWEGRVDARAEFYYNSAGYDSAQFAQALRSVRILSPWLADNIARFLQPGLELPGRAYSYLSLRVPDLGAKKDITVFLRGLNSLQDGTGIVQLAFEKPASDSVVIDAETDLAYGTKDGELTMTSTYQVIAGIKWTL